MATQSDAFQRTEQPTRLRLIEARRRGQVARSRDLTGAAVLVAAVIVVCLGGGAMIGELTAMMSRMLTFSPSEYVSGRTAQRAEIHQPRAERTAIRQERRPGLSDGSNIKPCKGATTSVLHQGYALTGLNTNNGPETQGVALGCRIQALRA